MQITEYVAEKKTSDDDASRLCVGGDENIEIPEKINKNSLVNEFELIKKPFT